jgi:hypothetical protein
MDGSVIFDVGAAQKQTGVNEKKTGRNKTRRREGTKYTVMALCILILPG